jgi:uncharacterized Zn finger protein
MLSSQSPFFAGLTFDILAVWAGEAVFQRGFAYNKSGKVSNIALTPEGGLLATVDGTQKYTTLIFLEKGGEMASTCTCPYGARCKHAVAVACAGITLLAAKTPIPLATADDNRLFDVDTIASPGEYAQAERKSSLQELEKLLKKLSKEQLVAIVLQAVKLAPEVANFCADGIKRAPTKDVQTLVKEARKAIRKALQEPEWGDYHWVSTDYEPVRKKLETLRVAGFPAEVLELGFDLIEDSISQIEMYDDEGETRDDIALCMGIVLQALRDVDWPLREKLLWAVDAVLIDDFDVCECFFEILNEKHPPEAWDFVADTLLQRIAQHTGKSFSFRSLVNMTVHALTAAGRDAEILELYKKEAVLSGEYLRLVEYLLAKDNDLETEEWIHKGIAVTEQKNPHGYEQLRSCLLNLRKKQKNWDAALCMQTEDFVRHASVNQFKECRHSAETLKVWSILRPLLMDFLIEKKLPWMQEAWPCSNRGRALSYQGEKHIDFTTLIGVAIYEKNPAEVLRWYDLQCKTQRGWGYNADDVATAVQDFAPERAVALWKYLVENQISLVKPQAYVNAAVFLRKMGKLMKKHNITAQWDNYIQSLRNGHRRKLRLMEVLDGLSATKK